MASWFKKFKKSVPITTSSGSTYYKRENNIQNVTDLKEILSGAPKIPELKTDVGITLNNISLSGITVSAIKKKFGTPSYILKNEEIDSHVVYFYKESVAYYKFMIQYHFINNKFFFAGNKISSMGVLNDEDKVKVISRISKKYLGKEYDPSKGWLMKVKDPDGNIIYTIDDVYFHLYYLANNKTTEELIKHYGDVKPQRIKPAGFNESLDQYI